MIVKGFTPISSRNIMEQAQTTSSIKKAKLALVIHPRNLKTIVQK
jgi:hypothetical protein